MEPGDRFIEARPLHACKHVLKFPESEPGRIRLRIRLRHQLADGVPDVPVHPPEPKLFRLERIFAGYGSDKMQVTPFNVRAARLPCCPCHLFGHPDHVLHQAVKIAEDLPVHVLKHKPDAAAAAVGTIDKISPVYVAGEPLLYTGHFSPRKELRYDVRNDVSRIRQFVVYLHE